MLARMQLQPLLPGRASGVRVAVDQSVRLFVRWHTQALIQDRSQARRTR